MSQLRVYLIGICVGACLSSMVYHHLQTEWRDQQLRTMVEGVFQINDAMKGRGLALTVQDTVPQCYCAKVNRMRSSIEFKAYMEDLYASEPPCLDNPDHPSCHYQPPEPLSCLLCSPHWDAPLPRTVNDVAVTRSPTAIIDSNATGDVWKWRREARPWYTPEMGLVHPPDSLTGAAGNRAPGIIWTPDLGRHYLDTDGEPVVVVGDSSYTHIRRE